MVNKDQVESWRESLYRVYRSGQQSMRVAVYGTKHDASLFEELLKAASQFEPLGTIGDTMIDTACLNIPKVRSTFMLTPTPNIINTVFVTVYMYRCLLVGDQVPVEHPSVAVKRLWASLFSTSL